MGDAAPRCAGEGFDETSPTTRQRVKGALAVVVMIGLLLVLQPVIRDAVTEHPIINGLRIGLPVAALVVGIAATLARSRIVARRARRIERLRPDAVVFIAPRTPMVRRALAAVRPGIGLPARFLVSAGWQGVELWAQSTDEAPTVPFSWREIGGVAPPSSASAKARTPPTPGPCGSASGRAATTPSTSRCRSTRRTFSASPGLAEPTRCSPVSPAGHRLARP